LRSALLACGDRTIEACGLWVVRVQAFIAESLKTRQCSGICERSSCLDNEVARCAVKAGKQDWQRAATRLSNISASSPNTFSKASSAVGGAL
jgi:hypothetical protein